MNGTGFGEPRGDRWRSVLIPVVVAVCCYGAGMTCMWYFWDLALGVYPKAILLLFSLGILCGLLGGVLTGRVLRSQFRRGRRSLPPLLVVALLNLVVFTLAGKPEWTTFISRKAAMLSASSLLGAVFLLAMNAYLLGFLFISRGTGFSGGKGLLLGIPLYASILGGIYIGFQSDIWRMGTVPLSPYKKSSTKESKMSWREALEAVGDSSRPEITVEEKEDGSLVFRATTGEDPSYSMVRQVIEATGPVVVGSEQIECHGYAIVPPPPEKPKPSILNSDDEAAFHEYAQTHTSPATFWSHDGQPGEVFTLPDYLIHVWGLSPWSHQCVFAFSPPGRRWESCRDIRLVQLPWGDENSASALFTGEETVYLVSSVDLPIPGSAEFRFRIFLGSRKEYAMPVQEGSTLTLETNRLLLAKLYPWGYEHVQPGMSRETVVIERPREEDLGSAVEPATRTTAVFYCDLEDLAPGIDIEAVVTSGETRESEFSLWRSFLVTRFDASLNEIKEFRIREVRRAIDVRYPIPRLDGFPPENENVKNRLDIWFASVDLGHWHNKSDVFMFLQEFLGDRYRYGSYSSSVYAPAQPHQNVTIRDILNYYYPHHWCVSDGRVFTTGDRFGPIVSKVREAVREALGWRREA